VTEQAAEAKPTAAQRKSKISRSEGVLAAVKEVEVEVVVGEVEVEVGK